MNCKLVQSTQSGHTLLPPTANRPWSLQSWRARGAKQQEVNGLLDWTRTKKIETIVEVLRVLGLEPVRCNLVAGWA